MKININDTARVTLTSYGLNCYNQYYIGLNVHPEILKNNVLEAPVWDIMLIFGRRMFMGAVEMVFVNNEIEIIKVLEL